MDKNKMRRLEAKEYRVGNAEDFLGLSAEESAYIDVKMALSQALVQRRKRRRLTQMDLTRKLNSSQSRVAKMEKGDPKVSEALLVKALRAMGATRQSIAKTIGRSYNCFGLAICLYMAITLFSKQWKRARISFGNSHPSDFSMPEH